MSKKPQPSRKRKGRMKLEPTAEGIAATSRFRARKYEYGPAQRGPTAPPTATRMHMELIEPIDRALGRGAAHLTAPPSDPTTDNLAQAFKLLLNKPFRPFADQQPRILSQMERVKSKLLDDPRNAPGYFYGITI